MMLFRRKKIQQVMVFPNGMVAVFDEEGHQMPKYQGKWNEKWQKIRRHFAGRIDYMPPWHEAFGPSGDWRVPPLHSPNQIQGGAHE